MNTDHLPRGRITIIFTDIEDSTRMTRALGDSIYREKLGDPHNTRIRDAITAHNGHEVKTIGDSFMVAFQRADDALACASAIQQNLSNPLLLATDEDGKEWTVKVHIGVHTAQRELFPDATGDYNGDDANYAARVESLGAGEQVVVSDSTYKAGSRERYGWKEWPNRRIKSFDTPETIWEMRWDGGDSRGEPGARWLPDWFMGERNRYIPRPELEERVLNNFAAARPDGSVPRLVTLHASGGMGKTRLAIGCAVQAAGNFKDGVFLVQLADRPPTKEALAEGIAAALELPSDNAHPDKLLEWLRPKEILLVLDNYESVAGDDARRFIGELLTGTRHLRLLITGRTPVGFSNVEQIISLDGGMTSDEARDLFLARARLKKGSDGIPTTEEEEPLAHILKLCAGIPLAIELAAAWVNLHALSEIAAGLDGTPLRPISSHPGHCLEEVERHRSLTRCLDWSFSLLGQDNVAQTRVMSPANQDHWDRLATTFNEVQRLHCSTGLFADTFTAEAAAAVSSIPNTQRLLNQLIDQALLHRIETASGSRYGMCRFTRAYAAERLATLPDVRDVHGRYVDYFEPIARENNDLDDAGNREVLEAEWRNIKAAAVIASRLERWPPVWQIFGNLTAFLNLRGWLSENEQLGSTALSAARAAANRIAKAQILINLGNVYRNQGRWKEAEDAYQQSLAIYRHRGNRQGEGRTLITLGVVYESQGRWKEAKAAYQQSLPILRDCGDRLAEGTAFGNLGSVYRRQGQWNEAEDTLQRGLKIKQALGDRLGEGKALHNLGLIYEKQSRWKEAEEVFGLSLAIYREYKDRLGQGLNLYSLGVAYRQQERWMEAEEAFGQSLIIKRERGDRLGEGKSLHNLGSVYQSQGRWKEAEESYQQSVAIYQECGDRLEEGHAFGNLGIVYGGQGRWKEAEEAHQQSLRIKRERGDRPGEGRTLINLALLSHKQGNIAHALELAREALAVFITAEDVAGHQRMRDQIDEWEREAVAAKGVASTTMTTASANVMGWWQKRKKPG